MASSQSAGKTHVLSICQYRSTFSSSFFQETVRDLVRTIGFLDITRCDDSFFYSSYGDSYYRYRRMGHHQVLERRRGYPLFKNRLELVVKWFGLKLKVLCKTLPFLSPAHEVGAGDVVILSSPCLARVCASVFYFRTLSRKPVAGLLSYFIHTSLQSCRCAFWEL